MLLGARPRLPSWSPCERSVAAVDAALTAERTALGPAVAAHKAAPGRAVVVAPVLADTSPARPAQVAAAVVAAPPVAPPLLSRSVQAHPHEEDAGDDERTYNPFHCTKFDLHSYLLRA